MKSRMERRQKRKDAYYSLFAMAVFCLVFFKFLRTVYHMMQGEVYYQ